jgi:SAM-dependent methyltransferase
MFNRNARFLFDQAAVAYDEARSGYPPQLINKLIELAKPPEKARILEIGCGTGQITRPFAERGYEIVAVELGEHLARMARANLAPFPNVQVIHNSFEEWITDEPPFDLVLSAQTFHWIDPEVGYPKIRHLLTNSGQLAVVYNLFPGSIDTVYQDLDRIYQRTFPTREESDAATSLQENVARTIRTITDSGLFREPVVWDHAWIETYTTDRYMKLLESFSDHRNMDESARMQLIDEVRTIIDKHGGIIKRPLLATLFLASVL